MAVIKILSRSSPSFRSLIEYILKEGKNDKQEIITHNLRSDTVHGWTKEFYENESFRKTTRSDQSYLFHEIISFSPEEAQKLTPEIMDQLAQEYMRMRGNEGVMIGAVHRDKGHVHLHLAVSALKFRTGTSFRLSKNDLRELKVSFQKYHTHTLGITKSVCEHGKGKPYLKDREWYALHKPERNLLKEEINPKIQFCLSKAESKKEFYELLRDENLHHYERNGVPTGIDINGEKFRFSRLEMDTERFQSLPDLDEEAQWVLKEIQSMRDSRGGNKIRKDRSDERINRIDQYIDYTKEPYWHSETVRENKPLWEMTPEEKEDFDNRFEENDAFDEIQKEREDTELDREKDDELDYGEDIEMDEER